MYVICRCQCFPVSSVFSKLPGSVSEYLSLSPNLPGLENSLRHYCSFLSLDFPLWMLLTHVLGYFVPFFLSFLCMSVLEGCSNISFLGYSQSLEKSENQRQSPSVSITVFDYSFELSLSTLFVCSYMTVLTSISIFPGGSLQVNHSRVSLFEGYVYLFGWLAGYFVLFETGFLCITET